MTKFSRSKIYRTLYLYEELLKGEVISKGRIAELFSTSDKSIQRDIDSLRGYLYETQRNQNIKYNTKLKGYELTNINNSLTGKELMAIIKVLLESRAFSKREIDILISKLMSNIEGLSKKEIKVLISDELFNYQELRHKKDVIDTLWNLAKFISSKTVIRIEYIKANNELVIRSVKPVSIIFSEYYFYLIAYFEDDLEFKVPIIYRVDRINNITSTKSIYDMPYSKKFSEGDFRKRTQFMYTGELYRVKFEFYSTNTDVVLDRLPTAEIISKDNSKTTFKAEIYGKGILVWLLSQGSKVRLLEPLELVTEFKKELLEMINLYMEE